LTQDEMLEMVDGVCGITKADELQRDYWLACLRARPIVLSLVVARAP
jgi:hypothetical protein